MMQQDPRPAPRLPRDTEAVFYGAAIAVGLGLLVWGLILTWIKS